MGQKFFWERTCENHKSLQCNRTQQSVLRIGSSSFLKHYDPSRDGAIDPRKSTETLVPLARKDLWFRGISFDRHSWGETVSERSAKGRGCPPQRTGEYAPRFHAFFLGFRSFPDLERVSAHAPAAHARRWGGVVSPELYKQNK